jgi:hypothetical protein
MPSSSSRQDARGREATLRLAAGRVARPAVQFAQCFKDGVYADGRLQSFRSPQRRARSDRRGVGGPGGQDRALLGQRQARMRYHVFRMLEDGARVQQRLEVEYVVVGGGRRPHVFLHSKTSGAAARHNEAGPPQGFRSSRRGFELMDVAAVDGDPPRLHGLGDLPDQFDLQQAVVERGVLDLNVVSQVELPLELPGRDAAVQEFALGLIGLVAFDRHDVLLGRDRDFVGREAGHRQRDLVPVFADTFDVVGRVVVLRRALGGFREVEKAVETDGDRPAVLLRAVRPADP